MKFNLYCFMFFQISLFLCFGNLFSQTKIYGKDNKIGIGVSDPQSEFHFKGDLTTNWGVAFYHYSPGWEENKKRPWLIKSWNNNLGNFLTLVGSGNKSNTFLSSIIIAESSILFGRGRNDGLGLSSEWVRFSDNGSVGIGVNKIPSSYKLAIDGKVICEELVVQLSQAWPDYVFNNDYNLMPLYELDRFILKYGRLPGIPRAEEVKIDGIKTGEMQRKLLEKVEELTIYIIELKKENDQIKSELKELSRKMK